MSLSLSEYARAKDLPPQFLISVGVADGLWRGAPAVIMAYNDEAGQRVAWRYRIGLDGDRFRWERGATVSIYGLDQLTAARKAGCAALVEGESDCHTLWFNGVPALGVPGASNWNDERDARRLDGVSIIYMVVEPDKGGETLLAKLTTSSIRDRLRLVSMPRSEKGSANSLKDPSDLWLDNRVAFRKRWEAACQNAVPCAESRQTDGKPLLDMDRRGNEANEAKLVPSVPLYPRGDGGQKSWKAESGKNKQEEACTRRYNGTTGIITDREEHDRQRELEIVVERERLRRSCKEIAESPRLLADVEEMVRRQGVVGESAAIRNAYLTASSRLNSASAICLLRRGAPAGGKNFLISNTLALIPADCIVHMSSGSPLSLVYYGGGDEDALKHKIVYVPEAAIIAEKNGVESPLTIMLRLLISEGRLDHNVALPQTGGQHATMRIKRNGPVVVVITSARDDVEEELLTRLMVSDADERPEQTIAVLTDALSVEDRDVSQAEVEKWLDYQHWLMIDAPYRVVIPFRQAILAAYNKRLRVVEARGEKPNVQLRLRRDVHGFLTAIKTSAILHKANRDADSGGRIIATIDDYRNAHEAFDEGLARLYKIRTPETALAVVRAVEAMGATPTFGVKVTVSALMAKLGITGRGAANDRLRDAEDRGFLRLVETPGGYGRTSPRIFEIAKTSEEVAGEIAAGGAPGVFPSPDEVEIEILEGASTLRYSGTDSTASRARPTVPQYQGGGLPRSPSESDASPSDDAPGDHSENLIASAEFEDSASIEKVDDTHSAVDVDNWRDRLL